MEDLIRNDTAPQVLAHSEAEKQNESHKCDFNPEYPPHDTQAARLLSAVLLGQKINPLSGWVNLGIYRLSDTKFRLKEMGWPMFSGWLDVSNKFGEACHVSLYELPQWAIEAVGDVGQEFANCEMALMSEKWAA